ncbi:U3 snoRNP-associated protein Esf2 [Schizosaccharomyces japonicus yFS275]|uniref:18S rRNA factor 2 n=1 Tax=Schizosaccharomyces japonicus (strain yFS275 / FY16936) TaxID=402676 RepID=B6K721_SCHJY|nr:U3 snoRNP-associated protein Esf2 [Schizosaccharomyces japonicus yFS275]EEB09325.1 U3 snoRNP-associated protein Esf2 [Schizosaccharomyces japonicus yFS275]
MSAAEKLLLGTEDAEEEFYSDEEHQEESRFKGIVSSKRENSRDDDHDLGSDAEFYGMDESDEEEEGAADGKREGESNSELGSDDEGQEVGSRKSSKKSKKIAKISPEEVEKARKAIKRSGVVYLSRIPPYMSPQKLRHLLSAYGKIGRIYLAPESAKKHAARVKNGGNKRTLYEEGWVEFESKRVAKTVAAMLNTQTIGGKKSNWYHDDIWNIKYLPKFKWHHLTEQIAAENAARATRLKLEIQQGNKELKEYVRNVERAKMIENMQKKRKERSETEGESAPPVEPANNDNSKQLRRFFHQKSASSHRILPKSGQDSEKVQNVLRRVL